MKFNLQSKRPANQKIDLHIITTVSTGSGKTKSFSTLPAEFKAVASELKKREFSAAKDSQVLIFNNGHKNIRYVLVLGLGDHKNLTLEHFRLAGATARKNAAAIKSVNVTGDIVQKATKSFSDADQIQAFVEGFILAGYQFTRYKKGSKETIKTLTLEGATNSKNKNAIKLAEVLCEGVCLARDLVNTPAEHMAPVDLAKAAKSLTGVTTKVHNLAAIKKMKMGSFLSVAQGSTAKPPYFIEMHYKPKTKAKKKIALVGKGVTFDSGGLSIKPSKGMETMKMDMGGSATVISIMSILHKLKPNVEVSGYVAATENMVDGHAQRPGDVCTAMNGTTIEVLNTDAEGRLTLADALTYANRKKPDYMIDLATLTGACLVALGEEFSGLMGNDETLIEKIKECGDATGDLVWHLPLPEQYNDQLKSSIADLKNIGSGYGGTLTAGLFLQNFVGNTKWAHLDIAGPAWTDRGGGYKTKGGTGTMVRALSKLITSF